MKYEQMAIKDLIHGTLTHFTFKGEDQAVEIAVTLVRQSAWFEIRPWPDDEWSVEVKWDQAHIVARWLSLAVD